jgi:putative transposase
VALRFDRSSHRYVGLRDDQAFLRRRIREIAATRVRYGARRIYVLLRREGMIVNHKRVRRLYRLEGLNLRIKRPRRHVSAAHRGERSPVTAANQVWAMDFVADALFDGRRLRALTLIDVFTRECLAITVGQGITGEQVVAALADVTRERGMPGRICVDNGPEFVSNALDRWAYLNDVILDFSRPGRPIDNAFIESFNGRLREECLNAHWFLSLDDARDKIEGWRRFYNESRPHTALGDRTPHEFASLAGVNPGQ